MKKIRSNKWLFFGLTLLVAIGLALFGKGESHDGVLAASATIISLPESEKAAFNENEKKFIGAVEKLANEAYQKAMAGKIDKAQFDAWVKGSIDALKDTEIKELNDKYQDYAQKAKDQGVIISELQAKMQTGNGQFKSIAETFAENADAIKEVYQRGSGVKEFMITMNHKGEWVARPFDRTAKAAGPHASIADVGGSGNVASISSSINAATILRMGGNAPIFNQYRNTSWLLEQCNVVNAGFDIPFAIWYEEQLKEGGSNTVIEGGTKPRGQYKYSLRSSEYKKEAVLIGFSQEFSIDFTRLQDDILNKGRIDVINEMQKKVLANITSSATAYNTGLLFNGGTGMTDITEYDVMAAMAAQADNATFGSAMTNSAIMSTFRKYKVGILKDGQKNWLNAPQILDGVSMIGNPDQGNDAIIVGDLKQYNIMLRGGFIVKVGYNGTDFADNLFSTVMEQFYFDYISTIRAKGIVKGPDFATVKTALEASAP